MNPGFGKYSRNKVMSEGNASVLVVVNSIGSYWDYSIVYETVESALIHFGIPYRTIDLAFEKLTGEILNDCSLILLAQSRIGRFLSADDNRLIVKALESGIGLVNFDNDIRLYDKSYLDIFGFEGINPHPYASDLLRIRSSEHYITGMQQDGEYHRFQKMVTAVSVEKWKKGVKCLGEMILGKEQLVYIRHLTPWSAFEPRNFPCVFAARKGKGKAVQFLINPRVWKREFYGHTKGLDDLFFRSIIWACKKPFAANSVPPFVTISFDDCSGRHDFKYVDITTEFGLVPMPALQLKQVSEDLFMKIREGLKSSRAEYTTHALDYYNHLYHKYGQGEYSKGELKEIFSYEDNWWKKIGAETIKTVRFHLGEMGVNALPFLKERGRLFINPALQTGLLKADMCMADGYRPYNLQNCYYDYLPDDHDFFVYMTSLERHHEDFLTGCTVNLRESDRNDIEKAAKSFASQVDHGLRAGFYAEIITHEQKFEGLSMTEWESILKRGMELTGKTEKIFKGHDFIGSYLKAKDSFTINRSEVKEGRIYINYGDTDDDILDISVFYDEGDDIRREYIKPQFLKGD